MKKTLGVMSVLSLLLLPSVSQAKPAKPITLGVMGMGNIQLVETSTDLDPGPGGGVFFDYRFNQRFSLTVDMWATTHNGTGGSSGDDSIQILGIPNATLKVYFMDNESSKWDPYAGFGIGAYATTEGSVPNGTNGVGLGARIDLGFDYHLTEVVSLGFAGVFHSVGVINSLDGGPGSSEAIIPFSLIGKVGFRLF